MSSATMEEKTENKFSLQSEEEFEKSQGITQAAYARRRGVTRQAISKHVKNGVITLLPNGRIDPEAADRELDDKLDPAFRSASGTFHSPANGNGDTGEIDLGWAFSKAKTVEKGYQAKIAELEFKKKSGEYINKKKAASVFSGKITAVVRRLQKIPKRISPAVAQESDRIKCEEMILNEIKEAVEEFGGNIHRRDAETAE